MTNHLYYGDNLRVLRESIADESVDLIYLDPPFNSNASYNVLFRGPSGNESAAQIEAFDDTWHWTDTAEEAFGEVLRSGNGNAAEMLRAMRTFLGENDMMAYLAMMAVRLLELHRVLKPTGSLYLHCDPTASHYLKILLDAVFGKENYRSEISWRRTAGHNDARQGRRIYGSVRDTIFFYTKSAEWTWNWQYSPYSQEYIDTFYKRFFPLQPHFGVNRIATWAPSTGTTVNTNGMPRTAVGTVSTPTLATTNLSTSMRRWRVTSAATADAAAEERSAGWVCWRGNADGLGGFTYVNRLSLVTLQATGMGFFGLYGSTTALATTLTLSAVVNCIGIGFQRGTHTNWQLVQNDASGAPTLTDLGASFPVASTTNVLTLTLLAAPNSSEIGVRVVEEVSGAVVETMIDTDIPAATQLLSPRNFMNNGATAAAVAYDCSGVYVETDY